MGVQDRGMAIVDGKEVPLGSLGAAQMKEQVVEKVVEKVVEREVCGLQRGTRVRCRESETHRRTEKREWRLNPHHPVDPPRPLGL